jgi:hypothetical protein
MVIVTVAVAALADELPPFGLVTAHGAANDTAQPATVVSVAV